MRWFVIRALFQHDDPIQSDATLPRCDSWRASPRLAPPRPASSASLKVEFIDQYHPPEGGPRYLQRRIHWKVKRVSQHNPRHSSHNSHNFRFQSVASLLRCIEQGRLETRDWSSCPLRPMNLARTCCQPSSSLPSNSEISIPLHTQRVFHSSKP